MSDLLTMLREHDLPPRWDDRLVAWRGWETQPPAFICPPPRQECCEAYRPTGHQPRARRVVPRHHPGRH